MSVDPILPRIYHHPGASYSVWTLYRLRREPRPTRYYVWRRAVALGAPAAGPELVYSGDDIHEAREAIPIEANVFIQRRPDDNPTIVESWLKGGPEP